MERTMAKKSPSALYLLFVEGFCLLFIAVAVIACGFVLNYHDDFDYDQVDAEHDYTQYWVGFVLLITAFLAIGAGTAQRSRWTVVSAMFLFLVSILVCLFALVVEGNDWINHKNDVRRMEFWESEDYQCHSPNSTSCVCIKAGADKTISRLLKCDALERLDHLYGALVCCILAAIFLALTSIIVVMIFIPIRPFTVPVPKKRIKRITVLEDKPEPPVVVYKPPPKRMTERKPEVEEIVVREVRQRRPPPRIVVQPEPEPEVEEIVVRERRPEARTIVYEPRQERQEVVRRVARKPTIIYDQPRFEGPVRGSRELIPIEAPPKPDSKKDQVYEVGRFVPKIHPTPDDPPIEGMENGFIVNPNFKKPETLPEPDELDGPEPVHYGTQEVEPPVRHVEAQQPVIRYVRREAPEQVRYMRQAPRVVHERRPRVVEERALVPVRSSRPKGHVVVQSSHPRPSYIIRRPGQRSLIAVRRPRSNSDEGPGLMRVRRTHRQHQRRHVYATQPVRAVTTRPQATTVPWQRVRSNSDEGPRLYRGNMPQERPARIYTDKEITAAGGNVPQGPVEGAKPRVFTGGNIGTTSLGPRPPSAHINQARNEHYDPALDVNLPSADQEQWSRRPGTPY